MKNIKGTKVSVYAVLFCLSLFMFGCNTATEQKPLDKDKTDTTAGEITDKETTDKTTEDTTENSASDIGAKEPEKYQAKVNLMMEAMGGESNAAMPKLEAMYYRDGANKRMEFNLPNGQKIVYLEADGKNVLVLPDKKQYAEINKDSVGMEIRNIMTPKQIVDRAKSIKGLEKVGEEKYSGRDATKYKYSATTDTNTKAGDVATESFVFVDKETGLPLKTEIVSESKDASVKGFNGVKIVTEMSDIKTEFPADMFKTPEDFEKIDEEQIKSQINLVFNVAGQFLKQMMENANAK